MSSKITIYREVDGKEYEIEVEISGDYTPASYGSRDREGAQIEPDEPAYWEVCGAQIVRDVFQMDDNEQPTGKILFAAGGQIDLEKDEEKKADEQLATDAADSYIPDDDDNY